MCQTMLCQECWQRLAHIRLCAKACYAKTAGRESSHLFMCQTMLCQECWQRLAHIRLCAKPCYAKTDGRHFLISVYVSYMLCQDCWQRVLTPVYVSNQALPKLLADTSSHLFMWQTMLCQTMLCQECWQRLSHICLCAKPCYAKTASRDFLTSVYVPNHAMSRLMAETSSHLFMCQTMLCQVCWQTLPKICLCAKPCYAKTAGNEFLTSVYVPNHAMPRLLAETSSHLFMCQTMLCQDCWQRVLTPVHVPNYAMPKLLADTSSYLFMCHTMLCQDC